MPESRPELGSNTDCVLIIVWEGARNKETPPFNPPGLLTIHVNSTIEDTEKIIFETGGIRANHLRMRSLSL